MSARKAVKRTTKDQRATLRGLEQLVRDSARKAEALREEIRHGPAKGRMLPEEGSRWAKHPAFVDKYSTAHVWVFLFVARGGVANNEMLAVMEREVDGKPYRCAVPLDVLFVEFIPVPVKKGARL